MMLLQHVKKMKPTQKHRPAIWENMLGTVNAANAAGKVEYFDYNYDAAVAHAGITPDSDLRVWRYDGLYSYGQTQLPRKGQWVWWILKPGVAK